MSTRTLTADVPVDLADKVDEMASRLERPAGWIVRQALFDWIGREERQRRMVLEGLADVDAGARGRR